MDVLLIEDDMFQATLISTMLEANEGTNVSVALSGEDALKLMTQPTFSPSLIVCDLSMPGMDGVEMLYHLSKTSPNACYAILSAANDDILESASQTALAYGIQKMEVFSKPLSVEQAEQMLTMKAPSPQNIKKPQAKPFHFSRRDFLTALANDELELHYQPQVCSQTSDLQGVEALVRWNHPERGLLSPFFFLDQVMKYDLGNTLTQWVVSQACKDTAIFQKYGIDCAVSINANASDVSERSFTNSLMALLTHYQLSPSSITIEVTESEFTPDATAMLETLTRLRLAGVGVSIDDFGTGYSSFHQLTTAPFNELKIDRSFTQQILTSDKHLKSVKAICYLCQELEIKTVVEGVETLEQQQVLQQLGADIFQGYYFAQPMSSFDFIDWARNNATLCECLKRQTA